MNNDKYNGRPKRMNFIEFKNRKKIKMKASKISNIY